MTVHVLHIKLMSSHQTELSRLTLGKLPRAKLMSCCRAPLELADLVLTVATEQSHGMVAGQKSASRILMVNRVTDSPSQVEAPPNDPPPWVSSKILQRSIEQDTLWSKLRAHWVWASEACSYQVLVLRV